MGAVDEIKDKLPIEELVGQYVQLKKVGRSLKGLCPFHSEKTPSFIVSPERGIAYCFGCNKGGDVFTFIQEMEGVDFNDALKILAERTGVKLDNRHFEKAAPKDQKELMIEVHEKTTRFYEARLWDSPEGAKVLEYLRNRGLTDESIKLFRIGFSPDSYDTTNNFLQKEGFSKKLLVSAGLAMTRETTVENIYDRFRGRLMFPIFDSLGRVVGFGGRALKKDQEPKYLNSPETSVYHKSNVLYGFSHSKLEMKKTGRAVLVEGYMDLIATFQAGVRNVVASSGTALTIKHLRLLKPFINTLILAFDTDLAGQEAAKRAYDLAGDFDYTIKVAAVPEGKDPADYAKNHPEAVIGLFENAPDYSEYFYGRLLDVYGTDGYSAKKKIISEFLPLFRQLRSDIEKGECVRTLAKDLKLKEKEVIDEINNTKLPAYHPARVHGVIDSAPVKAKKYSAEELLMGLMINFPRVAGLIKEKVPESLFSERLKPIYKEWSDKYNDQRVEAGFDVLSRLPDALQEAAKVLSLYVNEEYGELSEEAVEKEMGKLVINLNKNRTDVVTAEISRKIQQAEKEGDKDLCLKLMQELSNLRSYGTN
jgi:DNA primase